eukprot:s1200_g18.t1
MAKIEILGKSHCAVYVSGSNRQLQSFTKLKRSPVHCAMRKGGTGKVFETGSAPLAVIIDLESNIAPAQGAASQDLPSPMLQPAARGPAHERAALVNKKGRAAVPRATL